MKIDVYDATMESIGVRALRNDLATQLRRVAQGQQLQVTDHGRPVAVIGPSETPSSSSVDNALAAGRLRRPVLTGIAATRNPIDVAPGLRLDRVVDDVR
jgi:prevent-host-death family protein